MSTNSSSAGSTGQTLLLNAAGSTLAYPIYAKWFNQYHQIQSKIELNYASSGSGGDIASFADLKAQGRSTVLWGIERTVKKQPRRLFEADRPASVPGRLSPNLHQYAT